MKSRYRLVKRNGRGSTFYVVDTLSNKRSSLNTKDKAQALRLLNAKNEATKQPAMNLQLARVYMQHSDPAIATRTWTQVMEVVQRTKEGPTQERYKLAHEDKAFDLIRNKPVMETTPEHLMDVLDSGTVSTNVFLRRLHNFAMDMNWLPWPLIAKRKWPPVRFGEKRALTKAEHERIVDRERNPEWTAYYQLLWHTGGSQSDIAALHAEMHGI